jgi:hypothetical protein
MSRITEKQLDAIIERLNIYFDLPIDSWKDGKAQIGNLHLDGAYGGWRIVQHMTDGGGIREISPRGSRREIFEYAHAMLKGAQLEKERISKLF